MPGWWDEISKNATGLVSQLPQMIQPDRVAGKRLQEMVQQNPMLLEQFSNMDDGTRNMLAQSLGFKNENPIAQLPVGAQRQERETKQKLRNEVMADPVKREEMLANEFGFLTPQARQEKALNIEGKILDNKTGKLKIDAYEKETAKLEKILETKVPGLAETARALAFGQSVPAEQLQRIYADETLAKPFQDYYKAFTLGREGNIRMSLASMKTPAERAMAITWVEKELDNTRMNLQNLRSKLGGRDAFLAQMDPATRGQYQQSAQEAERLQNRLLDLENVYAQEMEKQGVKIPKNTTQPAGPITPGPLANPANRMPLNQLDGALFKR